MVHLQYNRKYTRENMRLWVSGCKGMSKRVYEKRKEKGEQVKCVSVCGCVGGHKALCLAGLFWGIFLISCTMALTFVSPLPLISFPFYLSPLQTCHLLAHSVPSSSAYKFRTCYIYVHFLWPLNNINAHEMADTQPRCNITKIMLASEKVLLKSLQVLITVWCAFKAF